MQKIIRTTLWGLASSLVLSNVSLNAVAANYSKYLENLSVDLAYGQLYTVSHEYVFSNSNSKNLLSQLSWKVEGAPIVRANFNYHIPKYFDVNLSGWHSVSKKQGYMDDLDWLYINSTDASHLSIHENTKLLKANEFDINITKNLIQANRYHASFSPILGYHQNKYSFTAKGGMLYYPEGIYKVNDKLKSISYKQSFATPYIGFNTGLGYQKFLTSLNVKYGLKIDSTDKDTHHLRNTVFETKSENEDAAFVSIDLKAKYMYAKKLEFYGDALVHAYGLQRGDAVIKAPDERFVVKNGSGYDNGSVVLSTGFNYLF